MATAKTPAKSTAKKASTPAKASKPAAPAKTKATAAKPAVSKPAAAKPAARRAEARERTIPADQRRNYIEVAAYFIAERHGFTPGRELADWAAAEAEIDRMLAEGLITP